MYARTNVRGKGACCCHPLTCCLFIQATNCTLTSVTPVPAKNKSNQFHLAVVEWNVKGCGSREAHATWRNLRQRWNLLNRHTQQTLGAGRRCTFHDIKFTRAFQSFSDFSVLDTEFLYRVATIRSCAKCSACCAKVPLFYSAPIIPTPKQMHSENDFDKQNDCEGPWLTAHQAIS